MIDVEKQIKRERRLLSAAKSRYKRLVADNKERFEKGNLKKNEGMKMNRSEMSAEQNIKHHEKELAQLLEERGGK